MFATEKVGLTSHSAIRSVEAYVNMRTVLIFASEDALLINKKQRICLMLDENGN